MSTELMGVLTIKKDNELKAVVYNNLKKRSQVFYKVTEMGVDEIKDLLDDNWTDRPEYDKDGNPNE